MTVNHYLYPLNPTNEFGYHFIDHRKNDHPTSLEGFLDCYLGNGVAAEWGVAKCSSRLKRNDVIWVYFSRPVGAIMAVGTVRDVPHKRKDFAHPAIWIDWDEKKTNELLRRPIPYEAFGQRAQFSVTPVNDRTLRVIRRWEMGANLGRVLPATARVRFKTTEVEQRLGQPAFRRELLVAYGNKCAVSGCSTRDVLQAAHITAVADGGHHNISNGLILRADLHNLFDRGLMIFDDKCRVMFDDIIKDAEYRRLHGRTCTSVLRLASARALAAHRKRHGWNAQPR